jgi:hypothetical protein
MHVDLMAGAWRLELFTVESLSYICTLKTNKHTHAPPAHHPHLTASFVYSITHKGAYNKSGAPVVLFLFICYSSFRALYIWKKLMHLSMLVGGEEGIYL